ncbi:unnamed protein product (macronuclear) [Paramecium tetraurelia]|uniref:EGF-like domain-containing protein n=1 Tax=Paramecium tetraurelia TaxID=5888 RepID=A0CEE1_PARTE|nr:uncharacterized protein GSPATT00037595001 [Paramecium tetraurelia]CAK69158.1 unnamed protein product [Paramecium tetraurelia]|eukprot:XP_001436555.1 hypothetical protein (macronuclear) [Paramecium tetraurelia strain d4-2]
MKSLIKLTVVCLIQLTNSQWLTRYSYLTQNQIFTYNNESYAYLYSGYFVSESGSTTANFITCTAPPTSYITLNKVNQSAKQIYGFSFMNGYFVSVDLYFQGTWSNDNVTLVLGSFVYNYTYTLPSSNPLTSQFCDNITADIRTINFTIEMASQSYGQPLLSVSNETQGQVSIKNFYISSLTCHPTCMSCTGPNFNQCTGCYYGVPTNNICPPCPSNLYFKQYNGCKNTCDIQSPLFSNGICQNYQIYTFEQVNIYHVTSFENFKWSLLYDPKHMDTSPTILAFNEYVYGVFKFNSGLCRFFNQIAYYQYDTQLIGIKISIIAFNEIPIECGIQFKINQTYFGSIYRNTSGIQMHKLNLFDTTSYGPYMSYTSAIKYELITYLDIPKYPFIFSAVGNFTNDNAGWGIYSVQITSGYCPLYCQLCEVSFKCKTCNPGYFNYRDGSCIRRCQNPNQQLNGSYCQDYDDETPYSMFLVQEYINTANDPEQYSQYTLICQNGKNFLKGLDIYYSYWQSYRVFGGPFVWAQAKFKRVHNILDPHHSLTIAFYILYGPTFPNDGQFIYTIENNSVYKSSSNLSSYYSDGSKYDKVYERISHNINTLTIQWECYGPNNEPINAYCGFYNYYIAVHKCKPYCLQCSDQNTCTQWNSTYNSAVVKFSQAECDINQFYDKEQVRCIQCPMPCLSCTSQLDCLSCSSTYTLSKLGCTCKQNQYEQSNQCYDCPIECNQCLSQTYCIECLISNNRQLQNGQCICIDGYYPIISNPQCLLCHQFCKTCTGPTSNDCLTCNNIKQNIGTACKCPIRSYYQDSTQTCSNCHSSCQSCFSSAINGCLTCNLSLNRILKGLKCECKPGYYEDNDTCTNCPITEDNSLTQCYKLCNNNQQIWHTTICSSCDGGFQLQYGECQPICGDSQIKGYEQCEDNNNVFDDKCYNCQYQCPAHCLTCNLFTNLPCPDICGDGYITGIEECEDGNTIQYDGCYDCKFQCQPQCTKCIKGECQECGTVGWFIDPTVTPWQCKERCGDNLIVGIEQCDDANTSDADGCKDCKYHCRIGCSSCDYNTNTCLSCEFPGFAPYYYFCTNICGDGLVVTDPYGYYYEQCDDGNTTDQDGCSSWCQFQCQPSSICPTCVNNRCEICASQYTLSSNKICLLKCQPSCIDCDTNGKGCLACQLGYDRIDNFCYSICGDGIVTDDEQCDDGNFILGDGCHFCQFNCQDSCLNCISGLCYDCLDGYELILFTCHPICGDALLRNDEQCEILNTQVVQNNCISCQFTCDINCQLCQFGICQQCTKGYDLSFNQIQCIKSLKITSTLIDTFQIYIDNTCVKCENQVYFEQVEQKSQLNTIPFAFCQYNLKLSPNICTLDYNLNKCTSNCKNCLLQKCIECEQGYYGNNCVPKCGDGIQVQEEECDDGIQYLFDSCLNCRLQCPQHCKQCAFGVCVLCQEGFYLDIVSNSCNSVCGDQIVALDEVCDDGNEFRYDGCFQCKFQCQMECLNCQFGKCLECETSLILVESKGSCEELKQCEGLAGLYYDNFLNDCVTKCGDGIVVGSEQCEDQNSIQYDGCYECKYQCDNLCSNCQKGECFECQVGYYLNGQKCETKCGDGIKIGQELCDDYNDIARDGCTSCKPDPFYICEEDATLLSYCYKCQENCEDCKLNINKVECIKCKGGYFLKDNSCNLCSEKCEECENTPNNCTKCITEGCKKCDNVSGLYLDKQLKSCVTKCGDNIIAGQEQCDDGNQTDKDGCNSKCEIEKEFLCKDGVCILPPKKQVILTYSNSTTTNDIDLTLEDIYIKDVCNKVKVWIEDFKIKEYQFNITQKEVQKLMGQSCQITFKFFKTILESNLIHLTVPLQENATRILEEDVREVVITPRRLVYYNEAQKAQAQTIVATSSTFTFLLQLIGPLAILLGGFNFFWTILDILTWINNFYFLNVDYPLNVKLFFNKLQWGDVFNIPDIISLNSPDDPYYFQAPPKFTEKDVNPLFLNNLQLFFGLFLLAIFAYICASGVVSIIKTHYEPNFRKKHKISIFAVNPGHRSIYQITPQQLATETIEIKNKEMPSIIKAIYKETQDFKYNFRAKLLQIVGLVFLDICLACVLQLKNKCNKEYAIIQLNIFLSVVGIIFIYVVFRLYSFVCSQHRILYESKVFSKYYCSLYEGINTKQRLSRNYCYVNLMRKALFIFFTVYFYEVPLLQTSLCCLTCFLNLALILYQNPFVNKSILVQIAVPDFCIFIIVLITVLLAIHDVSIIFSFDQKYFIGWIILFFIVSSILVQLIFLFKQFFIDMKGRLISLKNMSCCLRNNKSN